MASEAEKIIELYQRHAQAWACERGNHLFETVWLDRFLALMPRGAAIVDIGCGSAEPIARYFIEKGYDVTGVDSSACSSTSAKLTSRTKTGSWRTCATCL